MAEIMQATAEAVKKASELILKGDLVAFPTETVYGLGADATNSRAIAKIFAVKNRPDFNPLISHFAHKDEALECGEASVLAEKVAHFFWPGPLTLILQKRDDCPVCELALAGLETVAVRVPAHQVALDLLKKVQRPVAAPSANLSGTISPTRPHHVAKSLGDHVPMILAGGPTQVGLESTVLDLSADKPVILRPGAISAEDIAQVLDMPVAQDFEAKKSDVKSPGQLLKHYAPSLPVRLRAVDVKPGEALLGFGSEKFMGIRGGGLVKDLPEESHCNLSESGDLLEAAANLFAMLHLLDRPDLHKGIAVMDIPEEGIGIAINERLRRAAAR